jgi:CheY-like chemotaxis protein
MSPTLLVADHNVTTQRVVELTFSPHGINVVAVSNGQHAIERLAGLRPDVALVDLHLHVLNGYEVAGFARRHPELRNIPVLLLAGAFDNLDEGRVRESGAAGVIFKPFEPANIVARVKELLEARKAAPDAGVHFIDEWPEEAGSTGARAARGASGARGAGAEYANPGGDSPAPLAPSAPLAPLAPAAPLAPGFSPADAFALLLAEEQGEVAPPVVPQPIVELSDSMVDRIADRVADRLSHSVLGESLRRTVHEVSERLVRDEIARIRSAAQSSGTAPR